MFPDDPAKIDKTLADEPTSDVIADGQTLPLSDADGTILKPGLEEDGTWAWILQKIDAAKTAAVGRHVAMGSRKLRRFYKRQKKDIRNFEEVLRRTGLTEDNDEHDQYMLWLAGVCVAVTFSINICLIVTKIVSAVQSGSMTVLASLVDNTMDVVSNIIIWVINSMQKKHEPFVYPHGKSRLEPLGVMLFAIIMAVTGIVMMTSSVEKIIDDVVHDNKISPSVGPFDLSLFGATIIIKFILFLIMRRWKTGTIRALTTNHMNDVLINGVGIIMAFVGFRYWRFADPGGAIFICLLIVLNWIRTIRDEMLKITGKAPKPRFQRQITCFVLAHDPLIQGPVYIRASSFGEPYLVEVGLLLRPEATTADATRIVYTLKTELDSIHEVAVSFVTVVDPANYSKPVQLEIDLPPPAYENTAFTADNTVISVPL